MTGPKCGSGLQRGNRRWICSATPYGLRVARHFVLEPRETADELLSASRARCEILFTSTEPHFDFAQAGDVDGAPGWTHLFR